MSESEITTDGEIDDGTCPVCGDEYDHKRSESTTGTTPTLRADATACKQPDPVTGRTVYVHLNPRPVRSVTRARDSDDEKGLEALFT